MTRKNMAHIPLHQLKLYCKEISNYSQPEDLFGELGSDPTDQMRQLEAAYRSMMQLYHPDHYALQPLELSFVTEIAKTINIFRNQAIEKINAGAYGSVSGCDYKGFLQTSQRDYFVTDLLAEGSLADVYLGYSLHPEDTACPRQEVVLKIIADASNNRLVEREIAFYQTLTHFCFPGFIEGFRTPQGKKGIVLRYIHDGYDLIELGQRYRQQYHAPGVPQEHLFWMLDRFLSALGLMHTKRILHGNLQPDNLIVQPQNHNGVLIDFLHCRIDPLPDEVFAVVDPAYCAPELLTGHFPPHPVSDIYALGLCMIELLGGTGAHLDDSLDIHPAVRAFLRKMTLPDPAKRADDAWALAGELKKLRQQLYGVKPNFISLTIGGSHGRR
jgi:hypothetical protein